MTTQSDIERFRGEILEFLRNHGTRSFRPKEIARKLDITDNREYEAFRGALEDLKGRRAVATAKGGRISHRPRTAELTGRLTVHPDGYGFVYVENEGSEYFVRARRMNTAIDGDLVRIGKAAPGRNDRRQSAEVLEVLERRRVSAVGTLHLADSYAVVVPDDLRLTHDVYVAVTELGDASHGDKVLVSIDAFEDPRGALHGHILEVIGPSSDPDVQTVAVALDRGVRIRFPAEVESEAARLPAAIPDSERSRREDFRSRFVFTIDPEDARDFDDAIHLVRNGSGGFELGVHIADVGYFVPEEGGLDREAFKRGTSVYLVDRAIPMLPEKLSSDVCSLRPDEDRLAFSCIVRFSDSGEIESHRFCESLIHSRRRLTYREAQDILDGKEEDPELSRSLLDARRLAGALEKRRKAVGAIDFSMQEVKVDLDETGHPVGISRRERLDAHRLIEECMLLANRLVAEAFAEAGRVAVYRIHEAPDRERIRQLASYVRAFGYELPHRGGLVRPKDLARLLEKVRGAPEGPVIEQAALRAMAKARYATEGTGHYGLSFRHYAHFTSPIRRYPDLVMHRLLKAMLAGTADADPDRMRMICEHSSERERVAVEAERASVDLKKVVYALDHVGEEFDGIVTSVSKFGVYVELTDLLVEGLVHVRDMLDDYYELEERSFALVGVRTGRRFRPGDAVRVILEAARPESREIDLLFPHMRDAHGRGKKRRKR